MSLNSEIIIRSIKNEMGGFLIQASFDFLTSNTCRGFLYPPESIVALSNNF